MATTATARAAAGIQPREEHGPLVIQQSITHTVSANPAADDRLQLFKVPRGARILEVLLVTTDMDTGGSPTLTAEVGDGGDTDRFISSKAIGAAGAAVIQRLDNPVGLNYQYTAEDTIDVTFPATAATFAAGTITAVVMYSLDTI
ncbi:MAG: hypothetical protein WAT66_14605 [Actinomycetota bacterium]